MYVYLILAKMELMDISVQLIFCFVLGVISLSHVV